MSASLMEACSSFREAEARRAAEMWARSFAASTVLLRMDASCTARSAAVWSSSHQNAWPAAGAGTEAGQKL